MNIETQNESSKYEFNDAIKATETGLKAEDSQEHSSGGTSLSEVDSVAEKIQNLEDDLRESKDRYMRTLADMENMRRRHERDRSDLLKYASEKLLQDILPVLDSFEKAIVSTSSGDNNPVIEGVRMVHKQFLQILEGHGLKTVDAVGRDFDPNIHQAIQKIESDEVLSDVVKDEYQKGYTLNGRLVRPSMVSVLVPKAAGASEA